MDSIRTHDSASERAPQIKDFSIVTTRVIRDLELQRKKQEPPSQEMAALEIISGLSEEEELNPNIEQFANEVEYYLCCMGFFIGFENILTFPYMVFSNGGAVFLIPYITSLLLVVVPIYIIETAWGQLVKSKLHHKFSMIDPRFWGLSISMVWINVAILPYYTTMFPWTLSFFFSSFTVPLPWSKKETDTGIWNSNYFHYETLQRTEDVTEPWQFVPWLFLMLVLSFVIIYFTMWKGLMSSSQVVYFTVTIPYFILCVLLIKGLTLEGSQIGLRFLLVPEWDKLLDVNIWKAAAVQVVFSTGVTYGPLMFYATARKQETKLLKSSVFLPCFNSFTSIFASLTIFCFIGHVAHTKQIDIKDVSTGGLDLAFIAYPGLMTTLAFPNLWSILFFSMLLLVGIDSIFGFYDFLIAFFYDFFDLRKRMSKKMYVLIQAAILFVLGIPFVMNNGWWWFNYMSLYTAGDCLLYELLFELYVLTVHFGFDKLDALLFLRTGERFPRLFKDLVHYVTMPLMTIVLILSFYTEFTSSIEPWWMHLIGRFFLFMPAILFFMGFVKQRKTPSIDALVQRQFGITLFQALEESASRRVKLGEAQYEGEFVEGQVVENPENSMVGQTTGRKMNSANLANQQ